MRQRNKHKSKKIKTNKRKTYKRKTYKRKTYKRKNKRSKKIKKSRRSFIKKTRTKKSKNKRMVGGSTLEEQLQEQLQKKEIELQRCLQEREVDTERGLTGELDSLPARYEGEDLSTMTPSSFEIGDTQSDTQSDTGLGGIAGGDGPTSASSTDETGNIEELVQLLGIEHDMAKTLLITAEGNTQQAINIFDSSQKYGSEPNLHESEQARRGAEAPQTVSATAPEEWNDDQLFKELYPDLDEDETGK